MQPYTPATTDGLSLIIQPLSVRLTSLENEQLLRRRNARRKKKQKKKREKKTEKGAGRRDGRRMKNN